ncbi:alanine racemase [Corynebacterium heidelbergense]|uniref:Alanine racemase n=1 Tax=Corynebacterium heidelbergense TaxID=2055947 RepID=A0A364VA06_9CORY|nr:alanine racemase [Corynebacterium heidelbergense]RAV33444.1 alanine racemase [Corynebacterium heidelbergense]
MNSADPTRASHPGNPSDGGRKTTQTSERQPSDPHPPESVRAAVAHLDAPFAVLDVDAALANARDMAARAAGTPIRLASKSIRIPELMRRGLRQEGFRGILAYSLAEACWLVDTSMSTDVVVAYPTVHAAALRALVSDPRRAAAITLMVDSMDHLDAMNAACPPGGRPDIQVCIDVDASLAVGPARLGGLRSPLRRPAQVANLAAEILRRDGLRLRGVMAYEGQIAGTADTGWAVRAMKRVSAAELRRRRARVVRAVQQTLAAAGGRDELEFVNGGGTGSIESTHREAVITEIGAGSGVIGPGLFDHYRSFRPRPALWFVLPVVRRPNPRTVTVAGGGRVASGPVGRDRLPTVDFPPGLSYARLEGPGEVQTPLTGAPAAGLNLGDHVWFRHAKAGEASEFYNHVVVVSAGRIVDRWATYRGAGYAFS